MDSTLSPWSILHPILYVPLHVLKGNREKNTVNLGIYIFKFSNCTYIEKRTKFLQRAICAEWATSYGRTEYLYNIVIRAVELKLARDFSPPWAWFLSLWPYFFIFSLYKLPPLRSSARGTTHLPPPVLRLHTYMWSACYIGDQFLWPFSTQGYCTKQPQNDSRGGELSRALQGCPKKRGLVFFLIEKKGYPLIIVNKKILFKY